MATVRKLLEHRTHDHVYSVASTDTVLKALQIMKEAQIGAVLVTEAGKVVGIYTERDYVYKGEVEGRRASETPIKEVMTGTMVAVTPEASLEECSALMKKYRIRHLVVVENDRVLGLVSVRDVLQGLLEERESEIRGLQNYILGTGFQF